MEQPDSTCLWDHCAAQLWIGGKRAAARLDLNAKVDCAINCTGKQMTCNAMSSVRNNIDALIVIARS